MTGSNGPPRRINLRMGQEPRIAVLDMEWTSWEGAWARGWSGPGEFREVVEIGLVTLSDDGALTEINHFQVYVRPILNPTLSTYFINLTGITQATVDSEGVTLAAAQERMQGYLENASMDIYSHGQDGEHLRLNCERIGIPFLFDPERFININIAIGKFIGKPPSAYTSSDLPAELGFDPPGDSHTAVADCRCVAEALRALRQAGKF